MPSFTCSVLDLRFTHGRKSRRRPLLHVQLQNYGSKTVEKTAEAVFHLLKCRTKLPQHRKKTVDAIFHLFGGRNKLPPSRGNAADAVFHLFSTRFTQPTRQKKSPTSSFKCLVLDLRFLHGRSSDLLFLTRLHPEQVPFHLFGDRTMLLTQQKSRRRPIFTCLHTESSFQHGRRSRRRPLPLFSARSTLPKRQKKPPKPSFACLEVELYFPHSRRSHRCPLFLKCQIYPSHTGEEATDAQFQIYASHTAEEATSHMVQKAIDDLFYNFSARSTPHIRQKKRPPLFLTSLDTKQVPFSTYTMHPTQSLRRPISHVCIQN